MPNPTAHQAKSDSTKKPSPRAALPVRVARTCGLIFLVVASLLSFPSVIPWMVAVWLGGYAIAAVRVRQAWYFPVCCLLILVVKRPYFPVSLFALSAAIMVVGVVELVVRIGRREFSFAGRCGFLVLLSAAWVWTLVEWQAIAHSSQPISLTSNRSVVCIGDSLTSGVAPYGGYAADLQQHLSVPVINLGQAGITCQDALKLLPELKAAEPQVVVIELGGHDFIRGRGRGETMTDLESLINASRSVGAEVILMEIPRAFMTDPFQGLERELAHRHDLELVSDSAIRNLVLWGPHAPPGMWTAGPYLSDDGLHPNDHGNRYLAQRVAAAIK